MKKRFALVLSLALIFSLAACDELNVPGSAAPSPASSPSPTQEDGPTASPDPDYVAEYTRTVAGLEPDTVMFTVNGEPVTAEYFLYWLAYDCQEWSSIYQMYQGKELDFEEEIDDGVSMAQYLKEDARQVAALYTLLEQQAAANGAGMTEEQKAQWEQRKQQDEGEGLSLFLRQQGLSEATFDRIGTVNNFLHSNLTQALTSAPTKEELDRYTEENSVYKAKHILILTAVEKEDGTVELSVGGAPTNADGSAFTGTAAEYNAAALARAEGIVKELAAADDPTAKFDELMHLHSQDTGLAAYPDGYTFGPGEMVAEFEEGTASLDYGAYSAAPVQSTFGYHIILRLAPEEECRTAQMDALMQGWLTDMELETTAAYDGLDVKDFYGKFTVYAEAFNDSQGGGASPAPEG